jgi:uncharacterized protein with NRDE domain
MYRCRRGGGAGDPRAEKPPVDTAWQKVTKAKAGLAACLAGREGALAAGLFNLLADDAPAPDGELPDTGVGLEWERMLSPVFIAGEDYGTRSSTVVLADGGMVWFAERSWPGGAVRIFSVGGDKAAEFFPGAGEFFGGGGAS